MQEHCISIRDEVGYRLIMAASGKATKSARTARAESLVNGAEKHFPSGTLVTFSNRTQAIDEVLTDLRALIELRTDVITAKAAYQGALERERAQGPALVDRMDAFEELVRATLAGSATALQDFDLVQHKERRQLTGEEKVAAAAKRKATREARGTKGKRARLRIKGDVTGVTITPVVTKPGKGEPEGGSGHSGEGKGGG
jgi:hypothetical protein